MSELKAIAQRIRAFRDERDWKQFHNPKNLACSISIEAAELLEHFQWKTPEESEQVAKNNQAEIAHELADLAIYVLCLADDIGVDLGQAISEKLEINARKYPVDKAKGSATKYTDL
jgi:NTP pyrophosphatase (non-canonical NTP hydrolase)